MKNKILILLFSFLVLFIWSCNEEPPLAPETQDVELSKKLPVGTVTPVLPLAEGNSPEGITIDKRGNMYVSNTNSDGDNEILLVTPDGNKELYASLPWAGQARGLVTDTRGNVYVALADNPARKGVYRIARNRVPVRMRGSENIGSPNALTFDAKGNLYVTSSYFEGGEESYAGAIWRFGKDGIFEQWFTSEELNGVYDAGMDFDVPGANGIVFYPPNKLYVANTSKSSINCIIIPKVGKPMNIDWVLVDPLLLSSIDGLAVDVNENIYGVLPISTFFPLPSPLVMLNTNTRVVTPITILTENYNELFDTPTSLVFGTGGSWNRKSVFIANAALPDFLRTAGPGVIEVFAGIPGKPGK